MRPKQARRDKPARTHSMTVLRREMTLTIKLHTRIRLAILLSGVSLSGLSYADEGPARIMPLLRGYEWHFDEDRFRALPADSYHALLKIARSSDHPGYIRDRAMAALRLYSNDEVWAFFHESVSNADNKIRRRRAVQGMCETFAKEQSQRVENAIVEMLDSEDPHLRVKVARCLRGLSSVSAQAQFSSYRSKISESWELKAVDAPLKH